jgi:hypothetical protein
VHDILYEKTAEKWVLKKSYYRKLRISPQSIKNGLQKADFTIESQNVDKGMVTIIARR